MPAAHRGKSQTPPTAEPVSFRPDTAQQGQPVHARPPQNRPRAGWLGAARPSAELWLANGVSGLRADSDKTLASVAGFPRHLLLFRLETSALLRIWGHGVRSCPHTAPAVPSPPHSLLLRCCGARQATLLSRLTVAMANWPSGCTCGFFSPPSVPCVDSGHCALCPCLPLPALSSAPKGALPGPAADRPSPDQGPRALSSPLGT